MAYTSSQRVLGGLIKEGKVGIYPGEGLISRLKLKRFEMSRYSLKNILKLAMTYIIFFRVS